MEQATEPFTLATLVRKKVEKLRRLSGVLQAQINGGHNGTFGHDDRALDPVLELTHVAGPAMRLNRADRIGSQPAGGRPVCAAPSRRPGIPGCASAATSS